MRRTNIYNIIYNDFERRLYILYAHAHIYMYMLSVYIYIYSTRRSLVGDDDDAAADTMRNFPSHRL